MDYKEILSSIIENISPAVADLVPYQPGKPIEELKREYGIDEVIKLASNENPFGPSPMAIKAAVEAMSTNIHRYPDGGAYYLKKAIASLWTVSMDNIVLGNGSNEVIQFLIHTFSANGGEVISSDPAFLVYRKMAQIFGAKNVFVPLKDNRHNLAEIARNTNKNTRIIFLDNPHNPTGTIIKSWEFDEFLASLPRHVIVCLDEAYGEFVRDYDDNVWGSDYIKKDPRVVFLRTFSKAYGLSGLRVGYGVMDEAIAERCNKVRQPFNVNSIAQIAAFYALKDKKHLEYTVKMTHKGADFLYDRLLRIGFSPMRTNTNFILTHTGLDARSIYENMLRKGIIIRAMNSYGFPNSVRISIGTEEENRKCIDVLTDCQCGCI